MLWGERFWLRSYCFISVGDGARTKIIKRYTQRQDRPPWRPATLSIHAQSFGLDVEFRADQLKRAMLCLSLFCSTLSYGQDGNNIAAAAGLNPAQSIDRQSIVVAGPAVDFRLKSVYGQPQQLPNTQMYYQSVQYLIHANCSVRTMTIRQGRYFSTFGTEVYSFNDAPPPSNLDQKAMKAIGRWAIESVCRQQGTKKAI